MLDFFKMVLNVDFLYWNDIALYIQNWIATCNSKCFGVIAAIVVYMILKGHWHTHIKK